MAIAEIVDSLDAVPEGLREDYQPTKDGKFELKLVAGLRTNSAALLNEKKTLSDQLKAFEGIDAASLPEMKQVYQQHKDSKLTDKEKAEKALKERDEKIQTLESAIKSGKLKDGLRKIMTQAGIFDEDVEDVLALTSSRFDLNEKGEIVARDATDISAEKFFGETYKAQKSKYYRPEGGGGSGASNTHKGDGSQKSITRTAFDALSPADKSHKMAEGFTVTD